MGSFSQRKRKQRPELALVSFETSTAEVIARPHVAAERSVLYILILLLIAAGVFISIVKLDRLVVASGRLVPVNGTITVQPLEKAIITSVLVSVGDSVKKGQVLATLDPTFVQANLGQLEPRVQDLSAQRRRMEAEERGTPFQPEATSYDLLQQSIAQQRKAEYESSIRDFDQRIYSAEAQALGYSKSLAEYKQRLGIASETENMYSALANEKVVSHLQVLTVQDQRVDLERHVVETQNTLAATEHQLEALKAERAAFIQKWHEDNLTALVDVKDQLEEAEGNLAKAKKMSELSHLASPADAVVLRIPTLSKGGVVTDAQPMFSLVPIDAPLEAHVQIDSKDSGFVKVGDPVRMKFDTYHFLEHGTAEGVVKTVSRDAFTELDSQDTVTNKAPESTRTPYFEARVRITRLELHDVPPDLKLVPGMTLQADIVVGRRTILWYLLGGALRSGAEALHEP